MHRLSRISRARALRNVCVGQYPLAKFQKPPPAKFQKPPPTKFQKPPPAKFQKPPPARVKCPPGTKAAYFPNGEFGGCKPVPTEPPKPQCPPGGC